MAVDAYLDSDVAMRVARHGGRFEYPFALRIGEGEESFTLLGSIDAYVREGGDHLVVDYKTGSSEAACLEARYELQAACYALAALRSGAARVEVVFVRPEGIGPDGTLERVTFEFSGEDSSRIEGRLIGIWRRMASGERAPLGTGDFETCSECTAAGSVCPLPVPARFGIGGKPGGPAAKPEDNRRHPEA